MNDFLRLSFDIVKILMFKSKIKVKKIYQKYITSKDRVKLWRVVEYKFIY